MYDLPYTLARRLSTIDHLAEGWVAWYIVTSYLDGAARDYGLDTQFTDDERYEVTEEYINAVHKLWEGS